MLPFVILGAINAYIFLIQASLQRYKKKLIKVPGCGPFTVQHGVGGLQNS